MEILSLGEKIKKIRKEKDLTLKELAGNRITAAQISHIERDKSYPSQDLLEYFVDKLEVSIDYLLESKDMQAKKICTNLLLRGEVFIDRGDFESAKLEINTVIDICKTYEMNDTYAKAKFALGKVYFNQKNYKSAIESLEKSLVFNVKISNYKNVAKCYLELGKIYLEENYIQVAIDKFIQCENIFVEHNLKDNEIEKEIFTYMSYSYIKTKDNNTSLRYAQKIQDIEGKMKNKTDKANSLLLIGSNLLEMGNYDEAKENLTKAKKIYEEENKKNEIAKSQILLSKIYREMNEFDEALEYAKKAYFVKREYEDKELVIILFEYIKAFMNVGDFENSKKYSKKALSISIKLKYKDLEYKSLKYYAKVFKREGDLQTAIENFKKCENILIEINNIKELADLYVELAEVYNDICKDKEIEYYAKSIKLYKDLGIIEK